MTNGKISISGTILANIPLVLWLYCSCQYVTGMYVNGEIMNSIVGGGVACTVGFLMHKYDYKIINKVLIR